MMSKEEIRQYATEKFSGFTTYWEALEEYIDLCYKFEICKNTLQLTLDKLEASRRAIKRKEQK